MLEPHSRRLLADALRPPDGYALDTAIGTTYSLDLEALLTVPLAFTFAWEGTAAPDRIDPLALLEALRQHGERIHVFCQAGQIHVPKQYHALYSHLEAPVIQVKPPRGRGVFHAKTWLLRFVSDEGVRYRLLVPSRNLTFDRSWDTLLVLDGVLTGRKNAISRNHLLSDFLAALPGMAVGTLSARVQEAVERAQHEVRRVDFELPEPFEELVFWPLGIDERDLWPFEERAQRVLIVSPFLTEECIERIPGAEGILISQPESLAKLSPAGRDSFTRVYVLNDAADPVPAEAGDPDGEPSLSGLHAKLYITEAGWNASVWTGSANATTAAFGDNVELLVQLTGKKSRCGIESVLGRVGDKTSLLGLHLLQEFQPPDALAPPDPAQAEIEHALQEARTRLASASLALYTEQGDSADEYSLTLRTQGGQAIDLPEHTRVRCRPITMSEAAATELPRRLVPGQSIAVFRSISFEAVSAFMAFQAEVAVGGRSGATHFVLNLPLHNPPRDRRQRVLRSLLQGGQFLRYLLFLVHDGDPNGGGLDSPSRLISLMAAGTNPARRQPAGPAESPLPLFENLVRALHRNPASIDHIARVIADLKQTPEGRAVLPEGFDAVWNPIRQAREELSRVNERVPSQRG